MKWIIGYFIIGVWLAVILITENWEDEDFLCIMPALLMGLFWIIILPVGALMLFIKQIRTN
jgi:hypothetical protein